MRETLLSTQRMVDEMTAQARKEAQLILDEAQGKAGDIVRQAHQRLGQVHEDIANVKRWRSEFQTRFKGLLETYLRLLDTRDPDVERMEEMEAKLTFLKKAK
jgi:cell division initiation protein